MTPQVIAVKARLMQQHPDVDAVSDLCGGVNRLTAAAIYVACGRSPAKCWKVVDKARMALRLFRRDSDHRARQYEAKLLQLCLELAARTTAPAARKRKPQLRPS